MPRFTLEGFYQYTDKKLFDDIRLYEKIDKNTLVSTIRSTCGQLYPYYQVPEQFKENVEFWFLRNYNNFAKMFDAMLAEYNPIENYDRIESETITPNTVRNSTDTLQGTSGSNAINSTAGFNSGNTQVRDQQTGSANTKNTSTHNETESGNTQRESRIHGNIGVTTNQSMIDAELTLRSIDLYKKIANMFEYEFLVQIY